MKIYGEIHDGMNVSQKVEAANRQHNFDGWFDRIWDATAFRGSQKDILLSGDAVYVEREDRVARYQFTQKGDLDVVLIHNNSTYFYVIDRLSGERRFCGHVKYTTPAEQQDENEDEAVE